MRLFLFVLISLISTGVSAQLFVSKATIRLLPPGVPNTSAYFTIKNDSQQDRYIVAAQSDIADKVELHAHMMRNDMMRMMKQDSVTIPAGETVKFQPGGLHIMLFGLKQSLVAEQKVTITLTMQNGDTQIISATVTKPDSHTHH